MPNIGLCYRCEHRAKWYETDGGHQPRHQCRGVGDRTWKQDEAEKIPSAVAGCYMYKPVAPMVVNTDTDDPHRPAFGPPIISARVHAVAPAEGHYAMHKGRNGLVAYWKPGEGRGE